MLKSTLLYMAENARMREFVVGNRLTRGASRRFVAGETLEEAVEATHELNRQGIPVALDQLGENVADAREAGLAADSYIDAIEQIATGRLDANISIKLTALGLDIAPALCEQQVTRILERARRDNVFVCIDMEGSPYTERTVELTLAMKRRYDGVGTVIQSYLHRSLPDVQRLIANKVRLRLVKGAYKESPAIAFPEKRDVDDNYVKLAKLLVSWGNFAAIATHDEAMISAVKQYVAVNGIDKGGFEFQMLYGIRRDLVDGLVSEGYNVRVYVPYGVQWYPYLMRRMAERPANLIFVARNALR